MPLCGGVWLLMASRRQSEPTCPLPRAPCKRVPSEGEPATAPPPASRAHSQPHARAQRGHSGSGDFTRPRPEVAPPQQAWGPGSLTPPQRPAGRTQTHDAGGRSPSARTLLPDPGRPSRQTAGPASAPRPGVPGCKGSGRLASPALPDAPTGEADRAVPGAPSRVPVGHAGARGAGDCHPPAVSMTRSSEACRL